MALFLTVSGYGIVRLRELGARLNSIQTGYLPILKTVNSFLTFYHLDESFEVSKVVANRSNRLFLDSVLIHNPRLLESGLRRAYEDAKTALGPNPRPYDRHALIRIRQLTEEVVKQQEAYTHVIRRVLDDLEKGQTQKAFARNDELLRYKRIVRARIDFLSRRVDERIRQSINATVNEERRAFAFFFALSAGTLVLAFVIGLVAILSLRPLGELKRAAREIAAGDLHQRVQIKSHDEVGDLAREFNRMADAIEQRDNALRKQQEQLIQSEKMAVIGRMASKISHEVRNPLNALSLNFEMLQDEARTDEARKTLQAMQTEIDRLNRVTDNYLTLARTPKPESRDADLKTVLTHLDSLVRAECDRKNVRFQMDVSPELPSVRTDGTRMEQAFLNLFRNAVEAAGPGGSVGLQARAENGSIVVEVWDNGPGIPPDVLPRIFEPFFTTKEKGTGLGLAITSEIVREEGGSIECRSTPGEGTRFRVALPIEHHDV